MVPEYIFSSILLPCIDDIFGLGIFTNFDGHQRRKVPRTYNLSRTLEGLPLFERRPITCAGRKDGLRSRIRVREVEEERANVKPLAGEVSTSAWHESRACSNVFLCICTFFVVCMMLGEGAGYMRNVRAHAGTTSHCGRGRFGREASTTKRVVLRFARF